MSISPLDAGEVFYLSLANPNPTSSKTKDGPKYRISFEVDQDEFLMFMDGNTQGMVIEAACRVAESVAQPDPSPYGMQAQILHRSDFFRRPDVWKAVGSDEDFLKWLRAQPCVAKVPGEFVQLAGCEGDVVAAHVRRIANGAGTGIKPPYSAIPLCHHHHQLQHQHGEDYVGGKDYCDKQRIAHLTRWCWETCKEAIGVESMKNAPPELVIGWAEKLGINQFLPKGYVA